MDKIKYLQNNIWQQESYYNIAREGSLNIEHFGMKILQKLAKNAKKILDFGCGEGTRLNFLVSGNQKALGIDISKTAIKLAKKNYPRLKFKAANLKKIPVRKNSYDLVYSAFVLEHLRDPEEVLVAAIRAMSQNGYLVLIAPNFGAPNRASPPFKGSKVKKLLSGIASDFKRLICKNNMLNWQQVEPIATTNKYEIDWDTTIEPYMGSLLFFLKSKGLLIREANSCWDQELPGAKLPQVVFKILGKLHLYPFWMWGPHLVVVARKNFYGEQ